MPCCCACKSPFALLAVAGLGLGLVFAATGQSDAQPDPAKPGAPAQTTPPATPTNPPKKDEVKPPTPQPISAQTDAYVLGFNMKRIDGTDEDLANYKGKVILMVNVASQCGYTKQYAGLEKLFEEKKDKGFVILGFPANEFGKQEPGTNSEIKEFCTAKFGVGFPMFEKIVVKGEGTAPLYKKLAAQPSPIGGEPKWNFTKFLVDTNGNVVARYEPAVKPDDKALNTKIDELLKQVKSEPKGASPGPKGG